MLKCHSRIFSSAHNSYSSSTKRVSQSVRMVRAGDQLHFAFLKGRISRSVEKREGAGLQTPQRHSGAFLCARIVQLKSSPLRNLQTKAHRGKHWTVHVSGKNVFLSSLKGKKSAKCRDFQAFCIVFLSARLEEALEAACFLVPRDDEYNRRSAWSCMDTHLMGEDSSLCLDRLAF